MLLIMIVDVRYQLGGLLFFQEFLVSFTLFWADPLVEIVPLYERWGQPGFISFSHVEAGRGDRLPELLIRRNRLVFIGLKLEFVSQILPVRLLLWKGVFLDLINVFRMFRVRNFEILLEGLLKSRLERIKRFRTSSFK